MEEDEDDLYGDAPVGNGSAEDYNENGLDGPPLKRENEDDGDAAMDEDEDDEESDSV